MPKSRRSWIVFSLVAVAAVAGATLMVVKAVSHPARVFELTSSGGSTSGNAEDTSPGNVIQFQNNLRMGRQGDGANVKADGNCIRATTSWNCSATLRLTGGTLKIQWNIPDGGLVANVLAKSGTGAFAGYSGSGTTDIARVTGNTALPSLPMGHLIRLTVRGS